MASQALEQMLEFAPSFGQTRMYQTIDVYTAGTTALYTPPPKPFEPMIIPTDSGFIMPLPSIPGIRDYHDAFKIDRYDNPYGGHTTFDIPGFPKKRIDHGNDGW